MDEIKLMKEFSHPLFVKIIDDFMDSDGHICIVNELYLDGDFCQYLKKREGKPFSESEALHFLANIFSVVFHLNSQDIFHRYL
jgi:polo-like kinase 4